jgi:hypothetical protein
VRVTASSSTKSKVFSLKRSMLVIIFRGALNSWKEYFLIMFLDYNKMLINMT